MAATLKELKAQRDALDKQIAEAEHAAKGDSLAKIASMIEEAGLTPAEVMAHLQPRRVRGPAKAGGTGGKVAAKYRNPASGETWSGRGLKPNWLKAELTNGKQVEDFAV